MEGDFTVKQSFSIDKWGRGGGRPIFLRFENIFKWADNQRGGGVAKVSCNPVKNGLEVKLMPQKTLYFTSITPNSTTIAVCRVGWLQLWLFAPWCLYIDTI